MKDLFCLKKWLIYLLVFAIPFTQIAYAPVTYAGAIPDDPVEPASSPSDPKTVFDLVAIVVDSDLNADNNNYVGLKTDYPAKLSETKIGTRIKRYAEDVVANNELTDTKILLFDKNSDSVESLANALENLYLNGDGTRNNRLKGVVLVGDISLPVVTREGNRYVSLLPYTDFEEKAYLYDSITQSFVESSISSFPKPEAWHGVIKAPSDDLSGREKLATFFDKNHLYYEGETEYAEFDRKLFFGDLLHEEEQMYEESYKRYVQYLNSLEDLAYQRYNKYWANELVGSMMEDLPFNMDNPANQGENSFAASMQGDPLAGLPDMYTKFIIDQQLIPYYKIFNKYIAKLNDWTMYSARYKYGDVLSVPALIAMKDEYTKQYLKNVNSALETQFNEVAEKIQEPLPLVDYSTITGNIGIKNFSWIISDNPLLPRIDPEILFRFHYKNEETGKFYINGIDTDVIDGATAKICGMYLGSTKTDYFDEDKNFNPKSEQGLAAGGEYSILTRAMSSDDMSTAMPVHTTGVNTRMLSPAEITEATDGQYSGSINSQGIHQTGAIVEDNPEYGISAFIENPLYDKDLNYNNPLANPALGFQPGDVITAVNNKKLSYAYTFDQAIEDSYKKVENIINAFNKGNLYSIVKALGGNPGDLPKDQAPLSPLTVAALNSASINYFLAVEGAPVIIDSPEDIVAVLGAQLNQTFLDSDDLVYEAEDRVAGLIRIDYYRDGAPKILNLTFTVELDEDNADVKFTSRKAPESSDIPDTLVILDPRVLPPQPPGFPPILPPVFAGFDIETIGAIFTLYRNKGVGYGSDSNTRAYDNSAGCNANSTIKNSDRCLAKVATMPVLSPAGSTGLVKREIPGKDPEIMFPENVKKNTENLNSGVANDYDEHVNQFQFPEGVPFEDVDELIYDMCYSGLPGVILIDSNPYTFPLDPDTKPPLSPEEPLLLDYYGRLLRAWGEYVSGASDQLDYVDFDVEDETDDNAGYTAAVNAFNPKATVWGNIADIKASQVILNTDHPLDPLDGPLITLKDFSDHYGLFDGLDNDGDGLADFEWRDVDDDGVYETRYFDFDEANPIYGIPNANLAEVGRKMLSHDSEYIVPHSVDSFPYKKFDDDIVLKVNAHEIGKELSSVILHNEPTDYTVMEQIKAQATLSLPIDNPRYLSFLSEPVIGQAYPPPNPISPLIPVGAILAALGNTDPYYYPGQAHKVDYLNLFSEDITNVAQAKAKLSQKADQFALSNSSYRVIPGAGYGEYDLDDAADVQLIKNKIYNDYFDPVVSGLNDDPPSGFDLKIASVDKLHDALKWKSMNIDEKHEYVLKYYLNDAPNRNAYINDASLYPAPFAATPAFGYEAAYLMLDGEDDFFDINFNKDLEEDMDVKFNPLEAKLAAAEAPEEEEDAGGDDGEGGGEEGDFEFVMLPEFIKELQEFIEGFTTIPTFQDSCGFDEDFWEDEEGGAPGEAVLPLDDLKISVNKDVFPNSASEQLIVTVTGYDQNGKVVGFQSNSEMITLEVIQDEESPIFEFIDQNVRTLVNGVAVFKLKPAGNLGTATLRANSESGFSSNNIQVSVTAKKIELLSYVYFEIEGLKELAEAIAAGEGEGGEEAGGGEGAEGGAGLDGDGGAGTGTGDASAGTGADDGEGDTGTGGFGAGAGGGDGDTGAGDDGEAEGTVEGSFPGTELEDILSGLSEGTEDSGAGSGDSGAGAGGGAGAGDGADGSAGTGASGEGAGGAGEEPDITVLTSEPVEEVTLESVPVETEGVEGAEGGETGEVPGEAGEADWTEIPTDIYWEKYFMLDKYYEKFINESEPEARVFRRLVEQYSDRMLALNPDSINPFYDALTNEESPYIVESGSAFVADGESLMKIVAYIYNSQGEIDRENTHKVRFQIEDVSVGLPLNEILTFWTYENGKFKKGNESFSDDGIAEIYLEAGTKTGKFKLIAEVLNASGEVDLSYPMIEKEMDLVAGEPSSLSIESDSFVLLANNQSRTTVNVVLKDKFGNIADNAFATVALFVDDTAKFDETADQNKTILGTQIISFEGKASVDLISKDKVGVANVIAILLDYDLEQRFLELGDQWEEIDFSQEVGASKTFEILDNVDLEFEILNSSFQATDGITADGSSIARLGAKLTHNNQIVDKYSGPVEFMVLTKNVGNLAGDGVYKMANGEIKPANVSFQAATLSGEAEVLVDIPGFVSDTIKFKVKPGVATKIELVASDTSIHTNGQNEVTLKARLLDQYDNLVEANNGVAVDFAATEATEELIMINPAQANTVNGVATSEVLGKSKSGVANIFASSVGLETGTVSLKINKHLTSEIVNDFSPRALYVSLLGGAFGKVDNGNNIAQTLLYSGQVQAVSTITASPHDKKRVIGVDGFGKVDLLSQTLEITVAAATDSFPMQKVVLSDKISGDEVASVFVVPKNDTPLVLQEKAEGQDEILPIPNADGIYVQRLSMNDPDVQFNQKSGDIYIEKGSDVLAKIDKFGRVTLSDDKFSLELVRDEKFNVKDFALIISNSGDALALLTFRQSFVSGVTALEANSNFVPLPGIYLQLKSQSKKYAITKAFSGASTDNPWGFYVLDVENEIEPAQAPGFGHTSLEDGEDEFGLGFEGSNKHMLLFASGNSVGEANIPYVSDVGIVFGDPTIRLDIEEDLISDGTGYTKDLGQPVFSGKETITELIDFDFNGDGFDDLLLVYESGLIRLLENEISNQRFMDRGNILNIVNGIFSLTKLDVNNDGFDDLLVGTKEACTVGDECIALYENTNGHFERKTLNLALNKKKAYEMKAGDMNSDGCEDVVISDSSGSINVFYNKISSGQCTGLSTDVGYTNNFGYKIQSDVNLADQIFIYYPGMEQPDEGEKEYLQNNGVDDDGNGIVDDKSNLYKFVQFILPSTQSPPATVPSDPAFDAGKYAADSASLQASVEGNENIAAKELPPQTYPTEFNFINLKEDARFITTAKQATDINGESVGLGDEINYLIVLKNTSASDINNLILSDATPASMTLLTDSLECLDPDCGELTWVETGMSLRSNVISGINVPANGQRTIQYRMKVDVMPEIHFDIGNNFTIYPSNNNDAYLDILIKPAVNPDGVLTYLYSTGINDKGYVQYDKHDVISGGTGNADLLANTFEAQGLPDPTEMMDFDPNSGEDVPDDIADSVNDIGAKQTYDADYNGCNDWWGTGSLATGAAAATDLATQAATAVEGALSALRCSGGGCLPIPYNYAFLAPNDATPGFPTLAFMITTAPIPIPVMPFYPSQASPPSQARFYLSPTLSMGLGGGICVGPGTGHASPCFPFSIPVSALPGISDICGAIQTGIDEAVSFAKDSLVDPALGQATVISDGNLDETTQTTTLGGSFGNDDDPVSAAVNVNVRIPGFPGVITNWMDKQIDEIYNKLLDFPDLYLIYPDLNSIKNLVTIEEQPEEEGQESDFLGLHDFMTKISSIPLIEIEGREVLLKIPAISPKEIQQMKERLDGWLDFHKKELQRFIDVNCSVDDLPPNRRNFCDIVTLDVEDLIRSVERLLDLIDRIANLPRDILNFRYAEAKYATQIICYMDTLIEYSGGYFKRQMKIVQSWMKAVENAIKTFEDWQLIMDLIVDYQESCDQCKSDRFGKLGILMQLFAAIPEPPIIPLPKWPDLVFDFSQIRVGTKIVWPDVVFKPQPVHLPDIPPYFTLPDIIPDIDVAINIPKLDIPEFPEFVLPNLPDLPPLPLPQLPDIPRPPTIPALPDVVADLLAMLKPIFKILCLLKNGFILIPEAKLATEIETLTQPSVQAVLPIIKNLSIQIPPIQYEYVKEIRTNVKLNFAIETEGIYTVVRKGADLFNTKIGALIKNINKYIDIPIGEIISKAVQAAIDKAYAEAAKAAEDALELDELEESTGGVIDVDIESSLPLGYTQEIYDFQSNVEELNQVLTDYIATLETDYPEEFYLTASETLLDLEHPLLNRTIAEVEHDIKLQDLPDTPAINNMVAVRDELIAYVKDLNNSNALLDQIDDYDQFNKILVENDGSLKRVAALTSNSTDKLTDVDVEPDSTTVKSSLLGEAAEEMIKDVALKSSDKLIASVIDFDPSDVIDGSATGSAPPIGFYIVTSDGVNENVLNYTAELKYTTHVLYSDVDHDLDQDIVLSMGGDVYLKKNHKSEPALPDGQYIQGLTGNTVSSYVNAGGMSVQGVNSPYENNGKADVSWLPTSDAVAYEVLIRNSINDSLDDPALRYVAVANPEKFSPNPDDYDLVFELSNPDKPSVSLELENGNYYANVFAIYEDGEKSLQSSATFLAPQTCADTEPPFPAVGATDFNVAIFKELTLDASRSFDTDGEIVEYYIETLPYNSGKTDPLTDNPLKTTALPHFLWSDLNVTVDSNGDGITMNDRDNPIFKVGPFVNEGDIGKHQAILHVVDQSGNSSGQEISINVFAPEMTLDETFSRTSIATGESKPSVPIFPFSLMRNRFIYRVVEDELKLVPRIDEIKDALTKENGSYEITDFNLENMILVENADGEIVAEIDPETGNIGALKDGYTTKVIQATVPTKATHIQILDKNGVLLGTVYLVADPNSDVEILEEFGINADSYKDLYGVNVDDIASGDEFEWVSLPASDAFHPGGAILVDMVKKERLLIIDTGGNILILDDRITISQKKNDHANDPLIIEVRYSGVVIAEIYVATSHKPAVIVGPNDVPFATPRTASIRTLYSDAIFGEKFRDLSAELQGIAAELYGKGILSVGTTDTGLKPEDLVKRNEFTRALIKLLCIIPREEAYQSGIEYTDVPFDQEFFPYIKEGTFLGLVEGYKGEPDPVTGLLPFKPNNTITRAEGVKIILEALEMQGVIDLSGIKESQPWYGVWMDAGQDLSPYFKNVQFLENNFIVTPEEAAEPNKEMTFAELMLMAERVLNFYNCFEIDDDDDGMSDYCEAKYGIDDPKADDDFDELINEDECSYGLDPTDKDTDKGGIFDGPEVFNGTDGLDPIDDSEDDDGDGLTNRAEIMIHKTDYLDPDTDDGGVNDGQEVMFDLTDPLDGSDDGEKGKFGEGEKGIYLVPANCNTCPCTSTFLNKADLVPGDIFFPVVSTDYEEYYETDPKEKTYIFSKGNEVQITNVNE